MNEPNDTPPGQLPKYLIGDLGPARRHIDRLIKGELLASPSILREIEASLQRCVRRIERDMPNAALSGWPGKDETEIQK